MDFRYEPNEDIIKNIGFKKVFKDVPETKINSDQTKWTHLIAKLELLGDTDVKRDNVLARPFAHYRTSRAKILEIYNPFTKEKEESCFIKQFNDWFDVDDVLESKNFDKDTKSQDFLDIDRENIYREGIRFHLTEAGAYYYYLFMTQHFYKILLANNLVYDFNENFGHITSVSKLLKTKDLKNNFFYCTTTYAVHEEIGTYKFDEVTFNSSMRLEGVAISYTPKGEISSIQRYHDGHMMSIIELNYNDDLIESMNMKIN